MKFKNKIKLKKKKDVLFLALWDDLCPFKTHMMNFQPPASQSVTISGNKVFKEIIKLK